MKMLWQEVVTFLKKCDLYGTNSYASYHIFIDCKFARQLCHWFGSILQMQVIYDINNIINVCNCG